MNFRTLAWITPAVIAASSAASAAITVSVNFTGNLGAAGNLTATESAGVVPAANWNNVDTPNTPLVDSTGAASTIRVSFTVGGWSNGFITANTPDERLMKGYLDVGQATTTITISNLDPAATYQIHLLSDGENSSVGAPVSRTGRFIVNDVSTGITDTAGEQFEGTFHRVFPGTTGEGNCTVFTVTGSATCTISATGSAADGADNVFRAPVNGLQIVRIP